MIQKCRKPSRYDPPLRKELILWNFFLILLVGMGRESGIWEKIGPGNGIGNPRPPLGPLQRNLYQNLSGNKSFVLIQTVA